MALTLTIENVESLPDGGPLSIGVAGRRGIDIGRDPYLDWTLPDPSRTISGKHCEVRYQDGGYLLYDVSTNGTYLNGSQHRVQSPHRLRTGDSLAIGQYIIRVEVQDEQDAKPGAGGSAAPQPEDLWTMDGEVASPMDPRELRGGRQARPIHSDFLEQAMGSPALYDVPAAGEDVARRAEAPDWSRTDPSLAWAPPAPRASDPVEPAPVPPAPRRPTSPAPAVWDDAPAPAPQPAPAAAASPNPSAGETPAASQDLAAAFAARFAQGAGLSPDKFADRDALLLAQLAGELIHDVVVDLMQLLGARNEAKRLSRSVTQTVIQPLDNNPLKFSPTPEDALNVMLGPPTKSYLDARRALAQGFADLKSHQLRTYSAMQAAVRALAADLDPDAIAASVPASGGLSEMIGSRKARLWDAYVTRWKAKTQQHEDGLVDVFMLEFADIYDRGPDSKG
ncbi:type VI secretion system-associated FHA domain protein TagH [Alsobacter sp. SYSU BS001988]